MKWIFLLGLAGLVPALVAWLKADRRALPILCGLVGFLPYAIAPYHLYVAPISWAYWPGFVRGAEISLLDGVALAIVLSAPAKRRRFRLKWPILFLLAAAALSMVQAQVPMASFFYVWQLVRVFLVAAAVAIACRDDRVPPAIVAGFAIGLSVQAVSAGWGFLSGALQSGGGFGHQNQLGILAHFGIYPALAMLLAGRKGVMVTLGPFAGVVIAIVGASRATIGLTGAGILSLMILSVIRRPTSRKTGMAIGGVVALLLAAPLALNSLNRRLEAVPLSDSYDERAAFERASLLMLSDHPLGVGANEYVVTANTQGYSQRGGVIPTRSSRSAHVHNAYLLSAAEMGYPGLLAFTLMMIIPIVTALRFAFRFRREPAGDLLLGLGVSLILVALHSLYEWVFVTFSTQYLFGIAIGMVSGITSHLNRSKARKRNGQSSSFSETHNSLEPVTG